VIKICAQRVAKFAQFAIVALAPLSLSCVCPCVCMCVLLSLRPLAGVGHGDICQCSSVSFRKVKVRPSFGLWNLDLEYGVSRVRETEGSKICQQVRVLLLQSNYKAVFWGTRRNPVLSGQTSAWCGASVQPNLEKCLK
jgi:hypothetical protein